MPTATLATDPRPAPPPAWEKLASAPCGQLAWSDASGTSDLAGFSWQGRDSMHARYYNPNVARFLSVDPVRGRAKTPQSFNLYAYVGNNPVNRVDPRGLLWFRIDGSWTYLKDVKEMLQVTVTANGQTTSEVVKGRGTFAAFNGGELTVFNKNGSTRAFEAVSGRLDALGRTQPGLQSAANVGPIPAGRYSFNPANIQDYKNISAIDKLAGVVADRGTWPGGTIAWGTQRVELTADPATNTYGRGGFFIHGGAVPGSAGCVDLCGLAGGFFGAVAGEASPIAVDVEYP